MLSEKETRVLNETKLRNLKRKYSRIIQHADLTNEAENIQKEIKTIENQLN